MPDTARPAALNRSWQDYQARVTWQANAKNKFGFLYNIQSNCFCPFGISTLTAPEAGNDQRFPLQRPIEVDWTSPVTSKLLLEGYGDPPHRAVGRHGSLNARPRHDFR